MFYEMTHCDSITSIRYFNQKYATPFTLSSLEIELGIVRMMIKILIEPEVRKNSRLYRQSSVKSIFFQHFKAFHFLYRQC